MKPQSESVPSVELRQRVRAVVPAVVRPAAVRPLLPAGTRSLHLPPAAEIASQSFSSLPVLHHQLSPSLREECNG